MRIQKDTLRGKILNTLKDFNIPIESVAFLSIVYCDPDTKTEKRIRFSIDTFYQMSWGLKDTDFNQSLTIVLKNRKIIIFEKGNGVLIDVGYDVPFVSSFKKEILTKEYSFEALIK